MSLQKELAQEADYDIKKLHANTEKVVKEMLEDTWNQFKNNRLETILGAKRLGLET